MKTVAQIWQDNKYLLCLVVLLTFGVYIQTHSIGKLVYTFPDEGIYLYAAKLVSQGHLIYRDFFLAHLPFWIYINAFILQLLKWNIDLYHVFYACWVVSGIIPLYLILYSVTKKTTPATLACLMYLTFPEMMQWDAHLFAMRQASLPLLGWGLYHLMCSHHHKQSGVFFALFSLGLVTNIIISFIIMSVWAIQTYFYDLTKINSKSATKRVLSFSVPYLIIVSIYFALFVLIPNSINNVFGFQLANYFVPYMTRLMYIKAMLPLNWVILFFGLIGCFLVPRTLRWIGIALPLIFLVITFATKSFYPHYLVILGLPLALTAGFAIDYLLTYHVFKLLGFVLVIVVILRSSGEYMYYHLFQASSPSFYATTDTLSNLPEPVFTFEPIYALYAKKSITYHYKVADPRTFRILGEYYPNDVYINLLNESKSVLLDPYTRDAMPTVALNYLKDNFILNNHDSNVEIWVKK